jgi:hypothetical protein
LVGVFGLVRAEVVDVEQAVVVSVGDVHSLARLRLWGSAGCGRLRDTQAP